MMKKTREIIRKFVSLWWPLRIFALRQEPETARQIMAMLKNVQELLEKIVELLEGRK